VEKILSKFFLSPGAWWKTFTSKKKFQVQGHGEKKNRIRKILQVQRQGEKISVQK